MRVRAEALDVEYPFLCERKAALRMAAGKISSSSKETHYLSQLYLSI